MAVKKTDAGALLTEIVLLVFRLEGSFMAAAEEISIPAGLTAARWKVLGGVLSGPNTVADVGRNMGLARQSVQRIADILVEEGLAKYQENPAHKSAKLLAVTPVGRSAVKRLGDRQREWSNHVAAGVNTVKLQGCRNTLLELLELTKSARSA